MIANTMRTETIQLRYDVNLNLGELCHFSKNLWNETNYIIRQHFFETGMWLRYNTLAGIMKESENYRSLPAKTAQQILKVLDRSWNSFFKSIKEYGKHPDKFLGKPKLPNYKHKDGEFILVFTNQQVKIKDGTLKFPKLIGVEIKTRLENTTDLREVRIIPKGVGYTCEIVYKKEVETLDLDKNNVAGIDFGLGNIVTMGNNIGVQPIVIKGGFVKSINQYYNKTKSELQSIYDKHGIEYGAKMDQLHHKRNNKIKDAMHKISRAVITWCIQNNIGTLVIGYNENWKQNANLGRRNNQNFVSIPYYILKHDLEYKAEEVGIEIIEQEESHTSKCSFLDGESIEHHAKYLGKRIMRGLFRSAKGILINADVNASYNIIKKALPNAFAQVEADGIEGVGLHPVRWSI